MGDGTLKIGETVVYSLTSPPEQPEPKPPADLIAKTIAYGDRSILVTVPFPDTIELTADVLNKHLQSPDATGGAAKTIYKGVDNELNEFVEGLKKEVMLVPAQSVKTGAQASATFAIACDPLQPLNKAYLTLWRSPGADFGSWSVKLQFSASKATPAGLVKLTAGFDDALPLSFAAILPDLRVSRVDPAVDLIGAYPLDLIAHIQKAGKRLVYVGAGGQPETVYLYEKKAALKHPPKSLTYNTLGPLRMKLYERRDYHRQLLLAPPYGDCPVTRMEFDKRWKPKGQRPLLASLADIKNPFVGKQVAYAAALADQVGNPKNWLQFCLATFGGGFRTAQHKWQIGAGLKYRALYGSCPGDLIDEASWEGWKKGLEITGLAEWIKLAKGPG